MSVCGSVLAAAPAAAAPVGALEARAGGLLPSGGQRSCRRRLEAKPTHALCCRWSHLRGRQGCGLLRRSGFFRGGGLRGRGGGAVVGGGEGRACRLRRDMLLLLELLSGWRTGCGACREADATFALVLALLGRTARASPCSLPCVEHGSGGRSLRQALGPCLDVPKAPSVRGWML